MEVSVFRVVHVEGRRHARDDMRMAVEAAAAGVELVSFGEASECLEQLSDVADGAFSGVPHVALLDHATVADSLPQLVRALRERLAGPELTICLLAETEAEAETSGGGGARALRLAPRPSNLVETHRFVAQLRREFDRAATCAGRRSAQPRQGGLDEAGLRALIERADHDLQAPMRHAAFFGDRARRRVETGDDAGAREDLEQIVGAVSRLKRIIDSLIEFGRLEVAHPSLKRVSLADLVGDALAGCGENLRSAGAVIERGNLNFDVWAHRALAVRALGQILDNAGRYRSKGRDLTISMSGHRSDDLVVVSVSDTGRGLAEADLERALTPLLSVRESGEPPRTGMGLALVRQVMRLHGGALEMRPTPGGGLTVELGFQLPPPEDSSPSSPVPGGMREPP